MKTNNSISNPKVAANPLTAMEKIGYQKALEKKFNDGIKNGLIDNLGRKINSKNTSEKSRTVTVEGKEYTRTVSEVFATDKDFKNSIDIIGNNSDEFKSKLSKLRKDNKKPVNYIFGQDIKDSDSRENLELNGEIIKAIVNEKYNGSWFEFIKDSGLVKLDGDKIDKSELTSYRSSSGDWRSDGLGDYGYIWLRALVSLGSPIFIGFGGGSADWNGNYPKAAMRIVSQK